MTTIAGVRDTISMPPGFTPELIEAEIARRLPDEARAPGQPVIVVIMGPICAGKTALRHQKYGNGYVLADAAQLFIDLGGIDLDFPSTLLGPMEAVGAEVARRAVAGGMNIVTEIVGAKSELVLALIDDMQAAGYRVKLECLELDLPACLEREKGRAQDNVSADYSEYYQMMWLIQAARAHRQRARSGPPQGPGGFDSRLRPPPFGKAAKEEKAMTKSQLFQIDWDFLVGACKQGEIAAHLAVDFATEMPTQPPVGPITRDILLIWAGCRDGLRGGSFRFAEEGVFGVIGNHSEPFLSRVCGTKRATQFAVLLDLAVHEPASQVRNLL